MAINPYVPGTSNYYRQELANAKAGQSTDLTRSGNTLTSKSNPGFSVSSNSSGGYTSSSDLTPERAKWLAEQNTGGPGDSAQMAKNVSGRFNDTGQRVGGINTVAGSTSKNNNSPGVISVQQANQTQRGANNSLINGAGQQNTALVNAQTRRDEAFQNYLKNPSATSRIALGQREEELTRAKLNPEQKERLKNLTLLEGAAITLPFAGLGSTFAVGASMIGGAFAGLGLPGTTKDVVRSTSKTIKPDSIPFSYEEQVGAATAGFNAANKKASETGIPIPFIGTSNQLISGLPGATAWFAENPNNFKTGATQYFKGLGYDEATSRKYADKVFNIEGVGGAAGETASLFPIGAIGEIGVRTGVNKAVSKMGLMSQKEAALYVGGAAGKSAIVPAAVEGTLIYSSQQQSRRQPTTWEGLALSAGASAITGGLGARWIAKGSITNPKLTNVVYKSMWPFQPDEPAGDLFASIAARTAGKPTNTKVKYFAPTISVADAQKAPLVNFINNTKNSIYNNDGTIKANNMGSFNTPTITPSNNPTLTPTPTPTPSTTNNVIPSFPVSNNSIYNENYNQAFAQSNTYTNTWTNTATLSATTNAPFAPFLMPNVNFSGLGQGGRNRKRATEGYYDELSAAFNAFNYMGKTIGYQPPGFNNNMFNFDWTRPTKRKRNKSLWW